MGSGFLSVLNEVPDVTPDISFVQDYLDESGSGSDNIPDHGIIIPVDGPVLNEDIGTKDIGFPHGYPNNIDPEDDIGHWINRSVGQEANPNMSDQTGMISCTNSNVITLTCFKYNSHYKSEQVFMSYKIVTMLTAVLVIIGLIFNTLGIVVFLSKSMRRSSTRVYLLSLAISDNGYLVVAFLSRGLEGIKCLFFPGSSIDIYHQSNVTCKGLQYLFDLFSDFSASIILLFTIERFLACYYAFIYKEKCTPKFAGYLSLSLFLVIAILICPYHMLYIRHDETQAICKVDKESVTLFTYLYMAEATIFRIIPIYLIAIVNILIIAKLWKVYSQKKKRTIFCTSRMSTSTSLYSSSDNIQKKCEKGVRDQNAKTTLMLVLISTFYLLCYQPMIICYVINKLTYAGVLAIPEDHLLVFKNYSRLLYISGYTVNFFFYTLASEAFRQEIKNLCCLKHAVEDTTSYYLSARSTTHRPSTAAALRELERERNRSNTLHV